MPFLYRVHEGPTAEKLTDLHNFLKELAYRLGVEIDVSLMSEEEIYDFIKAMGHTEDTIKEVEEEIKKIKYKG